MRCLWERPPENSIEIFKPFRNRYTQKEVVQMTRRKTDFFTFYEFLDKFKERDVNNQKLQSLMKNHNQKFKDQATQNTET